MSPPLFDAPRIAHDLIFVPHRLQELERENARLKWLVADQALGRYSHTLASEAGAGAGSTLAVAARG